MLLRLGTLAFLLLFAPFALRGSDDRDWSTEYGEQIRPALIRFCAQCHDPEDDEDPVKFLRDGTAAEVTQRRGIWSSVAEQLRNRTMPPGDAMQPDETERLELAMWVESYLTATACSQGDFAGNPVPRRLNREQYTNAIEDLTGVKFDFAETIPADSGGGEGFNNNGETLFMPALLMERYLEVAQRILDHVILTEPLEETFFVRQPQKADEPIELVKQNEGDSPASVRLDPGTSLGFTLPVYIEADVRFELKANRVENDAAEILLSVDGIEAKSLPVPERNNKTLWTNLHFSRGTHRIDLRVPADGASLVLQSVRIRQEEDSATKQRERLAATDRILQQRGALRQADDHVVAERAIRRFARRAWRRPPTTVEIERLLQLYNRGVGRGESLRQAIKLPMKAVLVSPKFLFVAEQTQVSADNNSGEAAIRRISDLELASRLSLFLWHSIPDEELIQLAENNELHQSDVLRKQVRRMLRDPRSYRLAETFAGQWLGTAVVGRTKIPNTEHFRPHYTTELVIDLRRQVSETMHLMLRENRPVTEWIDCDYVVVNKRLAKHYRIEPVPVSNSHFDKIDLVDSPRPGVLGMGAVHMLTSYSRRTSPVLRGAWVLETIFGTRLPAPPPDAGALAGGENETKAKTVRQRLEKHRQDSTCAACHDLIDPIGFALENFDVLGRWRDKEGDNAIDAVGRLPSGESFTGPVELRDVLILRKDEFVHQLSRQMLGYALGRSLEDADGCTISSLTTRLAGNEYRMEELVLGIVESIPFQYRGPANHRDDQ